MANKKIYRSYKLKKIKIVPVFFLFIVLTAIILFNQFCLKRAVDDYIVNNRIREGHLAADRIYAQFSDLDISDPDVVGWYYDLYMDHDKNLRGIEVKQGDALIANFGATMPDSVEYYKPVIYAIRETNLDVAFSTEDNNSMVRGIDAHFDLHFGLNPWKRDNLSIYDKGHLQPEAEDYQDIWFEEEVNGYLVTIGYSVPLTYYDYQLCIIFSLFFAATGILIFIIVIILMCRIVRNQNGMVRAYYSDIETGGYNWYHFTTYANRKLRHINAGGRTTDKSAVVQLRFVKYNTFCSCNGEEAGRILLREIYQILRKELPKKSLLARCEGADFAIFLHFETEEALTERLDCIMDQLSTLRPEMLLSYKTGIYVIDPEDNLDAGEAYLRAAIACNKIEHSVDKNVLFFNQDMKLDIQWDSMMENDLERGLANSEFEVYLQPKYSCDTEQLAAAEALVRWNHPTEGFLTPYKFIPVFERTGLIVKLDDYMISNVARIQSEFLARGDKTIPISVNLSRTNFTRKDLADHICELVDVYKVPHNLIEIELTESSFFDDQNLIIRTARKLRERGFEVSLDDFGAGYSSLNSLRNIPIDIVKLDAGFFRGQDRDGKGDIIVQEVIQLAKQLDIKIVAEGIEEKSQVEFLRDAGCDLIQGYYYAKPMTISDYEAQYLNK